MWRFTFQTINYFARTDLGPVGDFSGALDVLPALFGTKIMIDDD